MVLRHRLHKHPFLEPSSNKFQSPVPSCSERRPSDVQRCPLPRNLKTISSRTNSLSHFAPGSTRPKKSKRIIVVLSHSNHTQLWMLESLVTCRSKPSGLQPGRKEIRGDRSKHWAREDMPVRVQVWTIRSVNTSTLNSGQNSKAYPTFCSA